MENYGCPENEIKKMPRRAKWPNSAKWVAPSNSNPIWVSDGKKTLSEKKWFPMRSKDRMSTPLYVSPHDTQRRHKEKNEIGNYFSVKW